MSAPLPDHSQLVRRLLQVEIRTILVKVSLHRYEQNLLLTVLNYRPVTAVLSTGTARVETIVRQQLYSASLIRQNFVYPFELLWFQRKCPYTVSNMAILHHALVHASHGGKSILIALQDSRILVELRKNTSWSFENAISKVVSSRSHFTDSCCNSARFQVVFIRCPTCSADHR